MYTKRFGFNQLLDFFIKEIMFNSPLIPQSTLVLYSDTTMASALHILELEIEISLRCQRVFRDRLNPLEQYSDREFIVIILSECILSGILFAQHAEE